MEVRYPPPQRGYLGDTCAMPYENKAKRMRYPPLRYYLERVLLDMGGISHWTAKQWGMEVWSLLSFLQRTTSAQQFQAPFSSTPTSLVHIPFLKSEESVTFLAGHGEMCHPHRLQTSPQHADTHGCLVWFPLKRPQVHVDRRVVGWSAGRHVDHPCVWHISPWPARKVTERST